MGYKRLKLLSSNGRFVCFGPCRVLFKKSKQHVPASEQEALITRNGSLCGDVRHKSMSCPRGQARNGAAHSNWDSNPDADVSGLPEELIIHENDSTVCFCFRAKLVDCNPLSSEIRCVKTNTKVIRNEHKLPGLFL